MPPLLVRCDAGPEVGAGHLMRCLALAAAWPGGPAAATFVSHCPSAALQERLTAAGAALVPLPAAGPAPGDLETTLAAMATLATQAAAAPWLVLDGYRFDPDYQHALRRQAHGLLVIDDEVHQPYYDADLVLNQNIGAPGLSYRHPPGARLLLGTSYVLLRPEFLAWQERRQPAPPVARKLLVSLGGSDPGGVALALLPALRRLGVPGLRTRVVAGPANPRRDELALAAAGAADLELAAGEDMAALMGWADVALIGGGTTCWEAAFMGLPACIIVLADNQARNAELLQRAGVARDLGRFAAAANRELVGRLRELILDQADRREMARRGRRAVDGRGAERVVAAMLGRPEAHGGGG